MSASHDNPLQRQKRVRLERKVSLKFKDLEGFVTELSENISLGGMFLRTGRPQPVGTLFDFELTLDEEGPLVQGIAEVMWVREKADGPEKPPGMGVRFLELAPGSRALIYQVVDQHIVRGGEPYDLHEPPPERSGDAWETGSVAEEPGDDSAADSGLGPGADAGTGTRSRTVRAGSYAVLASPQRRVDEERSPFGSWRRPREGLSGRALGLGAAILAVLGLAAAGWFFWPTAGDEAPPETSSQATSDGTPDEVRGEAGQQRLADTATSRDPLESVVPRGAIPEAIEPTATESPEGEPEARNPGADLPGDRGPGTREGLEDLDSGDENASDGGGAAEESSEGSTETPVTERSSDADTATELRDISWQRQAGRLVVTLTADGPWQEGRWDHFRMDRGTPREVVRLRGIREPFRPGLTVGETELSQIRTGHHRRDGDPELHVVLDLTSPRVRVADIEARNAELRITLDYP